MYIILYILALLFLPFTQSQNNNSSLCISLKNSKICPAFQNYSINTLRGPKWIQNSTTVESLDLNIHQYILSTPWWQLLSNNNNNNTCSSSSAPLVNSNSNNTRYFQTIVCYRLISRSIRTCQNNPSQPPTLCNNTCQQFIQSLSLNTTTSITNTCFNNQTTVYNQLCSPSRSINNNTCIDGYQNEAYCGNKIK
ncbi:hypothetical protein BJ944DRAFT_22389 [Cunninghamella echinulata]|nr:hypothetical protein BJ944DRAFT_22389 [Cunninghamella echinulata]